MDGDRSFIEAKLNENNMVRIEVTQLAPVWGGGEEDQPVAISGEEQSVSIPIPDFHKVSEQISGIVKSIGERLTLAAKKTTVEFGIEIGVEAGELTALIAKGSGKANLKITLEWS